MSKHLQCFILLLICASNVFSQANEEKSCRIAGGFGLSAATSNTISPGRDVWMQLAYRFYKRVSVAAEFENYHYKEPGYNNNIPGVTNDKQVVTNSYSLLLKYHVPIASSLRVALASGWSYRIVQTGFYFNEMDASGQHLRYNLVVDNEYVIPLLVELEYPLYKSLNLQARAKYNASAGNRQTYAAGLGVSLKI